MNKLDIRIAEKYFLTICEAAVLFNIGENKIRELIKDENCPFVLFNGNKAIIKRDVFLNYLNSLYSI